MRNCFKDRTHPFSIYSLSFSFLFMFIAILPSSSLLFFLRISDYPCILPFSSSLSSLHLYHYLFLIFIIIFPTSSLFSFLPLHHYLFFLFSIIFPSSSSLSSIPLYHHLSLIFIIILPSSLSLFFIIISPLIFIKLFKSYCR